MAGVPADPFAPAYVRPKSTFAERWDKSTSKAILQDILDAVTLAGRVNRGEIDQYAFDPQTGEVHTNPELVDDAGSLAGMLTLGAGAIPASANEMRMGIKAIRPPPETVAGASLKIGDQVFTATTHAEALDQALAAGVNTSNMASGFTTSSGRFVSREEALKLTGKKGHNLTSEEMPRPTGIRAYHGSPHSFDKFSSERIGTGEGAQAYGHGLYFAENEGVAKQYRETLGRGDKVRVGGRSIDKSKVDYYDQQALNWIRTAVREQPDNAIDFAIERATTDAVKLEAQGATQAAISARKTLERLQEFKAKGVEVENPGRTYEVDIAANPEDFLDWDKPLGQQPLSVKGRVADAIGSPNLLRYDEISKQMDEMASRPAAEHAQHPEWTAEWDRLNAERNALGVSPRIMNQTGGQILESSRLVAGEFNDKQAASAALRQAGIPGIRYLDQGSRNAAGWHITPPDQTVAGKWMVKSNDYNSKGMHFDTQAEAQAALDEKIAGQTSNYVVFDDSLISILKKYGVVGPVLAALGLSQALPDRAEAAEQSSGGW